MEDADPQRAAFLAMWHDTQETRTTDLPHLTKQYVTAAPNETVTHDQVQPLPTSVAGMIRDAVAEYETGQTPEARSPATPTGWNAFSKPVNTRTRATRTCSPGSTPPSPACTPHPPSRSPTKPSPRAPSTGSSEPGAHKRHNPAQEPLAPQALQKVGFYSSR